MDHGFEAEVDFAGSDDFGDILLGSVIRDGVEGRISYAWVIGLEDGDFDALVFEVALALGEVERGVVRGGMPVRHQSCSCKRLK